MYSPQGEIHVCRYIYIQYNNNVLIAIHDFTCTLCNSCPSEKEEEEIDLSAAPTVENRPSSQEPAADEGDTGSSGGGGDGDKIVFKRPVKRRRSSDHDGVLDASTKKTKEGAGKVRSPRSRKGSGSSSGVKNSSLLSFGDEEEDV